MKKRIFGKKTFRDYFMAVLGGIIAGSLVLLSQTQEPVWKLMAAYFVVLLIGLVLAWYIDKDIEE